jgi:hypothetical protein
MAVDKTKLPSEGSPKSVSSLLSFGANTLSSANAYKHGVVTVLECNLSNSTTVFVKFSSNSGLEIGGTLEAGTGTKVGW